MISDLVVKHKVDNACQNETCCTSACICSLTCDSQPFVETCLNTELVVEGEFDLRLLKSDMDG